MDSLKEKIKKFFENFKNFTSPDGLEEEIPATGEVEAILKNGEDNVAQLSKKVESMPKTIETPQYGTVEPQETPQYGPVAPQEISTIPKKGGKNIERRR